MIEDVKLNVKRGGDISTLDFSEGMKHSLQLLRTCFPVEIPANLLGSVIMLVSRISDTTSRGDGEIFAAYEGDEAEQAYLNFHQEIIRVCAYGDEIPDEEMEVLKQLLKEKGFPKESDLLRRPFSDRAN